MRITTIANALAATVIGLLLAGGAPGTAGAAIIGCTTDCVYTGSGSDAPSDATPLQVGKTYGQINVGNFSTNEYYSFSAVSTGNLNIDASFEDIKNTDTGFVLQLFNNGGSNLYASDAFEVSSGSPGDYTYTAALLFTPGNLGQLPAGNYVVGFQFGTDCCTNGGITFSPPVDPPSVPEPTSLALLGTSLVSMIFVRRRVGAKKPS